MTAQLRWHLSQIWIWLKESKKSFCKIEYFLTEKLSNSVLVTLTPELSWHMQNYELIRLSGKTNTFYSGICIVSSELFCSVNLSTWDISFVITVNLVACIKTCTCTKITQNNSFHILFNFPAYISRVKTSMKNMRFACSLPSKLR